MMRIRFAAILPALLVVGAQVFADAPGQTQQTPARPRADQYPRQQYQYQNQDQLPEPLNPEQQYYCDYSCDQAPMPYPPQVLAPVPLPPPVVVAPPPVIVTPPPLIAPYPRPYPQPYYGGRPYPQPYGRPHTQPYYGGRPYPQPYGRPYMNGGGQFRGGPQPTPYGARGNFYRRMSLGSGCEIARGNNGEVVVLSNKDLVIYSDSSVHAEENAKAMKAYYERPQFQFCSDAKTDVAPSRAREIEI